jgi:L-lactate dehydrogenase complex protein LldG
VREKDLYKALNNESIRAGILRKWQNISRAVESVIKTYPFVLDYAKEVKIAKMEVSSNYEYWIDKAMRAFENAANRSKSKCYVHYAKNEKDARKIIGEVVRSGKVIVKAKSMVSEEIGLKKFLHELGNEVWETDLGDFIVQLANDRPMHLIAPAIHYSKKQAARILEKVGIRGESVEDLAEGVRGFMREKFLVANVGISGCNAFSAETGRIFLVENEGNIRISTTLPEKYVAIVSIDKMLPSDELCLKSVLVQSAFAGTFPPSYININEPGSQEIHVVFLDNGRKDAPEFAREQLACIRCGRCQTECPVFQMLGNYWGSIYGGPMGLVLSYIITRNIGIEVFLCCLCGKCREVCPMEIDMPSIIRELRKRWFAEKR